VKFVCWRGASFGISVIDVVVKLCRTHVFMWLLLVAWIEGSLVSGLSFGVNEWLRRKERRGFKGQEVLEGFVRMGGVSV